MKYPNKCSRCGFCCLVQPCPVAVYMHRKEPGRLKNCPYLTFEGVTAACEFAPRLVPVGDGCCIKARCYAGSQMYDFASLPSELKVEIVATTKLNLAR